MPKVSVIIISYNMEKLIGRAIQSALDQTFRDFEIIVVDDGSTDNTSQVVKKFGGSIRYFYQENAGPSVARNRGILASAGEYLAFLDSDDYWTLDKLAIQVKFLDENPNIGMVYADTFVVDEDGKHKGVLPEKESGKNFNEILEKGAFFPVCAVMVRKECFIKAGIFNASVWFCEDIDMWLRIARYFNIHKFKGVFFSYYYRNSNRKPLAKIIQYKSQVDLYGRILYSYEDIPHKAVNRKLAMFKYLLGRSYQDNKEWWLAVKNISSALSTDPFVENSLFYGTESFMKKVLKLMRPYALLFYCFILNMISKKSEVENVKQKTEKQLYA